MELIYEGQGRVINFEEMREKLKAHPPETKDEQQRENVQSLEQCLNEILLILNKHNAQISSVPKLEVIAPGVFRLLGDLVLGVKKGE
jgi:hypothetical protein